jgi:hypothetical protein
MFAFTFNLYCYAVVATEASPPMVRRLKAKKFDCVVVGLCTLNQVDP